MSSPKISNKAKLEGFHPQQHTVTVKMTDGSTFPILTSWGLDSKNKQTITTLTLDVDPKNHPAWQDKANNFVNVNNEMVSKFKNKFGDFNFVGNEEKKEDKK
ncbi:50S ribosomal protein L31 [Alphaproteobacteria bacterium]|nr:50S ribosomal protein L31 [Alphaproteobacteria bacterium]